MQFSSKLFPDWSDCTYLSRHMQSQSHTIREQFILQETTGVHLVHNPLKKQGQLQSYSLKGDVQGVLWATTRQRWKSAMAAGCNERKVELQWRIKGMTAQLFSY